MSDRNSDAEGKRLVIDLESSDTMSKKSKMLTLEAADLVPKPAVVRSSMDQRKTLHKSPRKHSLTKRCLPNLQSASAKKPRLSKPATSSIDPLSEIILSDHGLCGSNDKGAEDSTVVVVSKMSDKWPKSEVLVPTNAGSDHSNSDPSHVDLESSSSLLDETEDASDAVDTESSSWHPSDDQEDDDEDEPLHHRSRRPSSCSHSSRTKRNSLSTPESKSLKRSHKSRRAQIHSLTEENPKKLSLSANPIDLPGSDDYCWICHKVGRMVICSCCPRVYHPSCLCLNEFPDVWLCPECQDLIVAECLLNRPHNWRNVTSAQLQRMLYFLIDRLAMQSWAEHFREPVDTQNVTGYADIVFYPMDLRTLYLRNKSGHYTSPQAFLNDFRWIVHNCIIFNGVNSALANQVRLLNRTCLRELALMKACPKCYLNRVPALRLLPSTPEVLPLLTNREWLLSPGNVAATSTTSQSADTPSLSKSSVLPDAGNIDPWWFCRLCDDVHPLVWVRLQHYPLWPAKVMAADGESLLVMFFGDYEVTLAPVGSAQLHSESRIGFSALQSKSNSATNRSALESASSPASVGACGTKLPTPAPPISPGSVCGRSLKGQLTESGVDASYKQAIAELNYNVHLLQQRYPDFKLPADSLDYSKKHVNRFYAAFGDATQTKTEDQARFPLCVSTHASTCMESVSSDSRVSLVGSKQRSSTGDHLTEGFPEPLLSRVAASFRDTTGTTNMTPVNIGSEVDRMEYSNPTHTPQASDISDNQLLPGPLHRIPASTKEEDNSSEELRSLLQNFRSQFDEVLHKLEEKWQPTRKDTAGTDVSGAPHVLTSFTIEQEAQTVAPHLTDSFVQKSEEPERSVDGTKTTPDVQHPLTRSLSALQAAIMEEEIDRLDRENRRLNLLLAFTRAEMAWEMRHRIMELRRVWNFELSSIMDAASKIWEQDLIRIVDSVKRKQWCAYCGRLAYYYCCWNTCYCNSVCQSKHWASHITVCVQARGQNVNTVGHADSESRLRPHPLNPQQQQQQQQLSAPQPLPVVGNQLPSNSNPTRWSMTSGS